MKWIKRKQKEIAHQFVEDATEKLKENVKESTYDYISLGLKMLPIAIGVAKLVTLTGMESAPVASTVNDIPSIINYGTINIIRRN